MPSHHPLLFQTNWHDDSFDTTLNCPAQVLQVKAACCSKASQVGKAVQSLEYGVNAVGDAASHVLLSEQRPTDASQYMP